MQFVIYVFAVFGVAWSLAIEDGPFYLFQKGRYLLGRWLGDGVECPICVGFWVALVLYIAYITEPRILLPLGAFGASTAIVLLISKR